MWRLGHSNPHSLPMSTCSHQVAAFSAFSQMPEQLPTILGAGCGYGEEHRISAVGRGELPRMSCEIWGKSISWPWAAEARRDGMCSG